MAEDKQVRLLPFIRKEVLYSLIVLCGCWVAITDPKAFRTIFTASFNAVSPVEIPLSKPQDSVSPNVVAPSHTTGYGTEVRPIGKSAGVGPQSSGHGESISKPANPERDWVDLTDKIVDWLVKLVGCAVAVYGASGLYNKNQSGVKQ